MKRFSLLFCAVLFLLFLVRPVPLSAQEKPTRLLPTTGDIESTLGTEWYGVYLQDKKIGWYKSERSQSGEGKQARFRDSAAIHMKLLSMGQKSELEISQELEFEASAPYRLLRGKFMQSDGTVKQDITVTLGKDGYDALIRTGKAEQKKLLPTIDYDLVDELTSDIWLRRGPKPGTSIIVSEFDLESLKVERNTIKLVATKESLVNGVKVVFHEMSSFSHKTKITTLQRHDEQGRMISGSIAEVFEMRRETEQQAKDTNYSADIFVLGMAKIDQPLGRTTRITSLVLQAEGKNLDKIIQPGPQQQVEVHKNGSLTIQLGAKFGQPVKATAAEIQEALEDSLAYPISDARVKALAAKAVGDAKTPREKLARLIHFTYRHIRPSLTTTLPKMLDLIDRKAGDCKSYALMFNTLARAAGIPAREVAGLVYMGDNVKAFGGHAWNEVVIDGYWIPVDASADEMQLDAAHLRLGTEQEATANTAATIGRLTLRLVEVEHQK